MTHISWDEYFMSLAFLTAMRSKDPSTKVGACLVDNQHKIVGIGYNGFPRGCDDALLPWARDGPFATTKYAYVVHAEINAVLNSNSTEQSRCYTTLFPCNECAKVLIQAGIKEIIFCEERVCDATIASRRMFDMANVSCRQYNSHTFSRVESCGTTRYVDIRRGMTADTNRKIGNRISPNQHAAASNSDKRPKQSRRQTVLSHRSEYSKNSPMTMG